MFAVRVAGCLLAVALSCGESDAFVCTSDIQCDGGRCEAEGVCSVPDAGCGSDRRYGPHAGHLSGQCVPGESDSGSGSGDAVALETSTTDTDTDTDMSATSSESGDDTADSGGPSSEPYGACIGPMDCPHEASICQMIGVEGAGRQCLPPCTDDAACPPSLTSDATPQCLELVCILDCTSAECPPGLQCDSLFAWCVVAE